MHERNRERARSTATALAVAAVALLIVLATAASYRLGAVAVFAGVVALLLARWEPPRLDEPARLAAPSTGEYVIVRAPAPRSRPRWLAWTIGAGVAVAAVAIVAFLVLRRPPERPPATIGLDTAALAPPSEMPSAPLDSLVVELRPSDHYERSFHARTIAYAACEPAGTTCAATATPRRVIRETRITSVPRGFLVREVRADPACPTADCPPARVRVLDLPAESFLAAEDVTTLQSARYFDSESVTWWQLERDAAVRFAVLPPPYPVLRPVLGPFIGLSGAGAWATSLFALLLALLVYLVTRLAGDAIVDWVRARARTLRRPRPAPEPALQPHGVAPPPRRRKRHGRG